MGGYTERFSEVHQVLAHIPADSETTETNTGYVNVSSFHRVAVLISVGDIAGAGTFDVDMEQATTTAGAGAKAITGKSTTQLVAADDDKVLIIELKMSELDVDGGFDCVNVECTPAVGAVEFAVFLLGIVPRFAPVSTTAVEEVVD